jgi:hypothetical protein
MRNAWRIISSSATFDAERVEARERERCMKLTFVDLDQARDDVGGDVGVSLGERLQMRQKFLGGERFQRRHSSWITRRFLTSQDARGAPISAWFSKNDEGTLRVRPMRTCAVQPWW